MKQKLIDVLRKKIKIRSRIVESIIGIIIFGVLFVESVGYFRIPCVIWAFLSFYYNLIKINEYCADLINFLHFDYF